jgi:NTE family protein
MQFDLLEEAPIPFQVIATDAQLGTEVVLTKGSALDAVLASAALPAVFPPVEIDGRLLIDGGVANNTPISTAIAAGATQVWVLSTGYSCGLAAPPISALAMVMHSVFVLVQQRLVQETNACEYKLPVHLIPPPCPITVTPVDFSQSSELIERARTGTSQWLANGRPNAMPLTFPHHHGHR